MAIGGAPQEVRTKDNKSLPIACHTPGRRRRTFRHPSRLAPVSGVSESTDVRQPWLPDGCALVCTAVSGPLVQEIGSREVWEVVEVEPAQRG